MVLVVVLVVTWVDFGTLVVVGGEGHEDKLSRSSLSLSSGILSWRGKIFKKGAEGIEEDIERKGTRLERTLLELTVNCIAEELMGVVLATNCEELEDVAMVVS